MLELPEPKKFLLAVISPCNIEGPGRDASKEVVYYEDLSAETIVPVPAISNVIGRIRVDRKWAIIDRSDDLAATVFTNNDEEADQTLYAA